MRSSSIFFGLSFLVRLKRLASLDTWVSTTTPCALLNALPSTTFAVLRATPLSFMRSSMLSGTWLLKSLTIMVMAACIDLALPR